MSEENKSVPAPRLRFPEFREGRDWSDKSLATVLKEHGQKDNGNCQVHSVSVHKGVVNQKEHLGRSFAAADTSNYNLAGPNDVIYTKSPTGDFPYGVVKQNRNNFDVIVSPLYGVFRPISKHVGTLVDCYFESPSRAKWFLEPIVQKGAKNTIQISNEVFLSVGIPLPVDPKEQQKIADCLSFLDELILTEAPKLDALKAHKKGLMQQLFPCEGETVPRLRFPEFRDLPEWAKKNLGGICKIQRGKFSHRPRNDPRFFGGKYPFIQTGDVVRSNGGSVQASQTLNELGLGVSKLFKPPIVLITIAANIGDTGLLDCEACFTDSVVGLIPNREVSAVFLELAVRGKKEHLNKIAPAAAQKNINNEILSALPVLMPSFDEQQRIAECLSSLDDLISVQSQRIAALKTHKRGLMQQLFPVLDEAHV